MQKRKKEPTHSKLVNPGNFFVPRGLKALCPHLPKDIRGVVGNGEGSGKKIPIYLPTPLQDTWGPNLEKLLLLSW